MRRVTATAASLRRVCEAVSSCRWQVWRIMQLPELRPAPKDGECWSLQGFVILSVL